MRGPKSMFFSESHAAFLRVQSDANQRYNIALSIWLLYCRWKSL